jgi:predicted ATP-dependent protease
MQNYQITGIYGNFIRNTSHVFEARTFQDALKKAEEHGLKLPLNFMEELKAREKGMEFPRKEVGMVYEIKIIYPEK